MLKKFYIILVLLGCYNFGKCNDDLLLTAPQRDALLKFKTLVVPMIPPQNVYMMKEGYLIKWLRAARFDVNAARASFRRNLRWREEHDMDRILNFPFSDVIMNYRIVGPDEKGRPVLLIRIASWDISHSALSGNRERFEGAVYRMLEDVNLRVIKIQAEGNQVTRYSVVVDLHGFSLPRHGCFACIPVYTALVLGLEEHFPQSVGRAAFINTPIVFEFILNVLKAAMSQELKGILEVYNSNKQTWPADLTKYAVLDNRPGLFNFNLQNPQFAPLQVVQPEQQGLPPQQQYPPARQRQPNSPGQQQQFPPQSQQQYIQNQQPPQRQQYFQNQQPPQSQQQYIQNQQSLPAFTNSNRIRYKTPSRSPVTKNPLFQVEDEY